ncbi:MAG: hypothetical protein LBQ54_00915 [Planctomycetaceae bacterium]|jgi:hypothetical protein|nr:hypothetical protein [Planctomycetaceae bacterium]
MKQREIIELVRNDIIEHPPVQWIGQVSSSPQDYGIFWRFEVLGDEMMSAVIPESIEWQRVRGAEPVRIHEVDVVIFGKNKTIETIAGIMDGLEELAERFMNDGGPIEELECIGAGTIDAARAGYDQSRVKKTAEPFLAGIRLTFRVY